MFYTVIYIVCIILANITASTLFTGFGLTFTLGTFFFGFIFTLRDIIHAQKGRQYVYRVIIVATGISAFLSMLGVFDMRIVAASVFAFAFSETIDTEIFQKLAQKNYTNRVLTSNLFSIPLDTILFVLIAFYGKLSDNVILSIIFTQLIIKFISSAFIIKIAPLYLQKES